MAGYIPDDIVQRIKSECDIVSIISGFVSLKQSGKDYKGLCPFHQERTPSFYVVPDKGFYHCFGCGASGNVVNFVMQQERMEYPEALRFLAAKAGIPIPETGRQQSNTQVLYDALSLAGSYFSDSLNDPSVGKSAASYLEKRSVSRSAWRVFGLGFAPGGWDGLIRQASAKGLQPSVLERAGLAIRKEGYYDRFRNRLMVPIRNLSGRIVGFGGRILPGDDGPKYINSPETEVYKKGQILFGLDMAKEHIRERRQAVVVEGYFDLISLFQRGINNVVAASGTGFTREQAFLLARFSERVVLIYDADSAGLKAAFRACGVLYDAGLEPCLVRLPKGYDPDSFIQEKGASSFGEQVKMASDPVDFVYSGLSGKFSQQPLWRQEKIIRALAEMANQISDPIRRELLIEKICARFDISPLALKSSQVSEQEQPGWPRPKSVLPVPSGRDRFERSFLGLLLAHPERIGDCAEVVDHSLFTDELNASIYDLIVRVHREGREVTVSNIFDEIQTDKLRTRFSRIAFNQQAAVGWESVLENHLRKFELIRVERRLEEIKSLIGEAERRADREQLERLTREFQTLKSEVGAHDTKG